MRKIALTALVLVASIVVAESAPLINIFNANDRAQFWQTLRRTASRYWGGLREIRRRFTDSVTNFSFLPGGINRFSSSSSNQQSSASSDPEANNLLNFVSRRDEEVDEEGQGMDHGHGSHDRMDHAAMDQEKRKRRQYRQPNKRNGSGKFQGLRKQHRAADLDHETHVHEDSMVVKRVQNVDDDLAHARRRRAA